MFSSFLLGTLYLLLITKPMIYAKMQATWVYQQYLLPHEYILHCRARSVCIYVQSCMHDCEHCQAFKPLLESC